MNNTNDRLNKISMDINDYFGNKELDGYTVLVTGFTLVFSNILRFLIDIDGAIDFLSIDANKTDEEIKLEVSNRVFGLLDKLQNFRNTAIDIIVDDNLKIELRPSQTKCRVFNE
jgi:hypothetical protein